jgi:hypothetical protein
MIMTIKTKGKKRLNDMTKRPSKTKSPQKDLIFPKNGEITEISEHRDKLYDQLKVANLRKREIITRYKRIFARLIPEINAANRKMRRSAKWLRITDSDIEIDEHARIIVNLKGTLPDDEYLDTLNKDNCDKQLLLKIKKLYDISELYVMGKNNYNEHTIDEDL